MNKQHTDKAGIEKYKNIFFYIFVLQILWAIFGNIFFKQLYFILSIPILFWGFVKLLQMMVIQFGVNIKFYLNVKQYERKRSCIVVEEKYQQEIIHTFILPNFKEEIQFLKQTLNNLSSHQGSKNYIVFLAMEKLEQGAEAKATKLIQQFSNKFRLISYTIHQLKDGETKGKPSNIDYCVRQLKAKLLEQNLTTNQVLVHIMDADSLMPHLYIDEVQNHLRANYNLKDTFVYQPPQIFTRNDEQAHIFIRYVDNYMSLMQSSQLYSLFDVTIGVSNYSISYNFLEKIDFFDTFQYSQTQDLRTPLKGFWNKNGQVRCVPIYAPFNQLNLQTHEGFFSNLKAKLTQIQRHSEAHLQFAYNFDQFMKTKKCSFRKFYVVFAIFEMIVLHFLPFIPLIVIILQDNNILQKPEVSPPNFLLYFNIFTTIPIIFNMIQFEIFKVFATRKLYKKEKKFSFYLIIISLLGILLLTMVAFLTMVISFYRVFRNKSIGYEVTMKKIKKTRSLDSIKEQNGGIHQGQFQQEQFIKSQILEIKSQQSQIKVQNQIQ